MLIWYHDDDGNRRLGQIMSRVAAFFPRRGFTGSGPVSQAHGSRGDGTIDGTIDGAVISTSMISPVQSVVVVSTRRLRVGGACLDVVQLGSDFLMLEERCRSLLPSCDAELIVEIDAGGATRIKAIVAGAAAIVSRPAPRAG